MTEELKILTEEELKSISGGFSFVSISNGAKEPIELGDGAVACPYCYEKLSSEEKDKLMSGTNPQGFKAMEFWGSIEGEWLFACLKCQKIYRKAHQGTWI